MLRSQSARRQLRLAAASQLYKPQLRAGYNLANAKEEKLTHEDRNFEDARRAAEESIELARVLADQSVMSGQEFLERMARSDDMAFLDPESDGMTHNIVLGAQVAREMLEAGEYEDVVQTWARETQRRWRTSKFFKLWQAEQQAGRDPHRAFHERGWEP
ncbi:MAG TPA: hypothetical protein VJ783_32385 [Pirellulales bacterium]|nr:hypothetical protein [Pirellulales bacterium]